MLFGLGATKISRLRRLKFVSLWQNVWWDGVAQRASWCFSDFANVINAALRTSRNFPLIVKFDVRRQVVGEIYGVAIGQVMFQSKLICGGINLAKIVNASISIPCRTASPWPNRSWHCNRREESNNQK
jgi:hypothetical protein